MPVNEGKVDGAQALDRAVTLLKMVGAGDGSRLSEIVAESGLTKPTVHRMLKALERNGLVEQDSGSRKYYLGPEALVLGVMANRRHGIRRAASGTLVRLANASHDVVFLSIPRDTHAVCIERLEGDYPIRTHVLQVGSRHPLGVGAGSLAILAKMSDEGVEDVLARIGPELAQEYPAFTPDIIRKKVQEAREQGFAFNPGYLHAGSWAIGAAVIGSDGECLGAISISAIESRLGPERRSELGQLLLEEVAQLSQRLAQPDLSSVAQFPTRTATPRRSRS